MIEVPPTLAKADEQLATLEIRGTKRCWSGATDVRLAVPVRDAGRPLAGVVLAHLVVVAVRCPHVARRRPVAASVLEAVIALTALHTHLSICAPARAAIPLRSETAAARHRPQPGLPVRQGSARAEREGRLRELRRAPLLPR